MEYKPSHKEDQGASGASGERHRACCLGWVQEREELEGYRPSQYWRLRTGWIGERRKSDGSTTALGRACPVGSNAQAKLGPRAVMVIAMTMIPTRFPFTRIQPSGGLTTPQVSMPELDGV